jgi:hypothetical protein
MSLVANGWRSHFLEIGTQLLDVILHGRTGGWIDIRERLLLNDAAADDRRVRRRWTTRPRILCARAASKT